MISRIIYNDVTNRNLSSRTAWYAWKGADRLSRAIAVLGPSAAGGIRPEIGYAVGDCARNYNQIYVFQKPSRSFLQR